jgi:hypothetical protein
VISVTFRGYLSALATSGRGAAGRTGLDAPPLPVGVCHFFPPAERATLQPRRTARHGLNLRESGGNKIPSCCFID